jgi:transcriptional regulator with XRE-family HTH domain
MTFSEKIKHARTAKNMSQKELANATGISERTIQNYELGTSLPKSKNTYDKLAAALGINPQILLDENAEFVLQAGERYGNRGRRQAEDIIRSFRVAAAGGELDDDDLDFIKEAMLQTYEDAKAYNRRFVNRRYQSGGDND